MSNEQLAMSNGRTMKDSGIEWIGEIPVEWEVHKTKNDFHVYSGATPKSENADYWDGDIIWITPADYKTTDIYVAFGKRNITKIGYDSCGTSLVPKDSLIFTKRAPIGTVAISQNELCTNQGCLSCVSKTSANVKYYYYAMSSFTEQYNLFGTGTTFKEISFSDFCSFKLPFPSIGEQQEIVTYLDTRCAEIDSVVAETEKTIEEYKALKQSIITEAVTKGVRGKRPMKDSGIEWIGEIPEEWKTTPIKHLKSKEKNAFVDGPFGSNLKSTHYVDNGDVYVVESGFISTGKFVYKKFKTISMEHFKTIDRSECKGHDIIIAKIGANYGMAAELPILDKPSVVSGNSLKITLNNSTILNTIFVWEMEMAKKGGGYIGIVNETAQPALSLGALNDFKLVVSPMIEQQEIVAYLDTKCAEIDKLIAVKQQLLTELETYKKSLIYEYVTGKKEVPICQ